MGIKHTWWQQLLQALVVRQQQNLTPVHTLIPKIRPIGKSHMGIENTWWQKLLHALIIRQQWQHSQLRNAGIEPGIHVPPVNVQGFTLTPATIN